MKPGRSVDGSRSHLRHPFTCYITTSCGTDANPRGVDS
jgi:hypothetical protein